MSKLDQVISAISPSWGLRRRRARQALAAYDAAKLNSQNPRPTTGGISSGDAVVDIAREHLRAWARYLEENSDVAVAVLDDLVAGVVGTGLRWEPGVLRPNGEPAEDVNDTLRELWDDWWRYPEVTREHTGRELERLLVRSWLRDGEVLLHHVMGPVRGLVHRTDVPYALEALEADYLPYDLTTGTSSSSLLQRAQDAAPRIVHGVEKNAWGARVAYHIYKEHPGNTLGSTFGLGALLGETKRVPADLLTHLRFARRLSQTRGVTALHSVIHRIDHLRDLDNSELVAARVAANFAAVITKHLDLAEVYDEQDDVTGDRSFKMQSGMVFDNLAPGESVASIGTERPNPNLPAFRADMMRAIAAGAGAGYSRISRHFDTSYAAQRAEQVLLQPQQDALSRSFCQQGPCEIWRRFVDMALLVGLIPATGYDQATLHAVEVIRGGGTPWVDPKADIESDALLMSERLVSRQHIQRVRGIDGRRMDREMASDDPPDGEAAPDEELDQELAEDQDPETRDDEDEANAA